MAQVSGKALLYSCSGCSSAAQMANMLAVRLDRGGVAEMGCIAGVGGNVTALVKKLEQAVASGRAIVAVDGCPLHCTAACLARHNVKPTLHFRLAEAGVKKRMHNDFDAAEAEEIQSELVETMRRMGLVSENSGDSELDSPRQSISLEEVIE